MTAVVARIDDFGLPGWIAVMVLGFIVAWPIGLAVLAYLLWSGRMGCGRMRHRSMDRFQQRMADTWERGRSEWAARTGGYSSGNHAFDEYRSETLRRLEDEERAFREFLDRLRHAKDREQFDQFMADRRNSGGPGPGDAPATT